MNHQTFITNSLTHNIQHKCFSPNRLSQRFNTTQSTHIFLQAIQHRKLNTSDSTHYSHSAMFLSSLLESGNANPVMCKFAWTLYFIITYDGEPIHVQPILVTNIVSHARALHSLVKAVCLAVLGSCLNLSGICFRLQMMLDMTMGVDKVVHAFGCKVFVQTIQLTPSLQDSNNVEYDNDNVSEHSSLSAETLVFEGSPHMNDGFDWPLEQDH